MIGLDVVESEQLDPENVLSIDLVRTDVEDHPETSVRRRASQFQMSVRSLRRILKIDLSLFPYKVQLVQKLLPVDAPRRLEYANFVRNIEQTEPEFWSKMIMSDEAHFTLSGSINKQNCRFWGTENPNITHELPLRTSKSPLLNFLNHS